MAEELDARLTAALTARLLGDGERATACLDVVRSRRRRGPLLERSRAWHAEAVHRLDGGHRGAAGRAVEAGLDAVAGLQALMGSTELRVGAAGHGAALAELGLRIAVDAGDAWAVLRLLDQWRGASLDLGTPEDLTTRSWRASWPRSGRPRPGSTRRPRTARTRLRLAAPWPSWRCASGRGLVEPGEPLRSAPRRGPDTVWTGRCCARRSARRHCSSTSSSTVASARWR